MGKEPVVLSHFRCPDEEILRACAWVGGQHQFQLAVAGQLGVVRVIGVAQRLILKTLAGHIGSVNAMCTNPVDPDKLLTASSDCSVRLWDTSTGACLAIFGGVLEAHHQQALFCRFHPCGSIFASGGVEGRPYIWNLLRVFSQSTSLPVLCRTPTWKTKTVHQNWIESLEWCGNYIMSKARGDLPKLWFLSKDQDVTYANVLMSDRDLCDVAPTQLHLLRTFKGLPDHFNTTSKMALDAAMEYLAVGIESGAVYIWQVDYPDVPMAVYQLDSVITSLAFSAGDDARMLVATTSEGYLHCFQLI